MAKEENVIKIAVSMGIGGASIAEGSLSLLKETLIKESGLSESSADITAAIRFLLSEYTAAKLAQRGGSAFVTEIQLPSGKCLMMGDSATLSRIASTEVAFGGAELNT